MNPYVINTIVILVERHRQDANLLKWLMNLSQLANDERDLLKQPCNLYSSLTKRKAKRLSHLDFAAKIVKKSQKLKIRLNIICLAV